MKNFGIATRKYIGATFDECSCLQLLYKFFTNAGIKLPDSYKGYNLETYLEYWKSDPENAIQDMVELFKTIGTEVDTDCLQKGDAVIVRYKSSKFPSLYIGDNKVMASSIEEGVRLYSLGNVFVPIMARRLLCRQ